MDILCQTAHAVAVDVLRQFPCAAAVDVLRQIAHALAVVLRQIAPAVADAVSLLKDGVHQFKTALCWLAVYTLVEPCCAAPMLSVRLQQLVTVA